MEKVRIGIIGAGNIGSHHIENLMKGKVAGGELTAICDCNPDRLKLMRGIYGEGIKYYGNHEDLFNAGVIDGVIIATPHYDHPVLAIKAFNKQLHVLIEKPAGVYTRKVREMNEAAKLSGRVFGIMYNQRTNPLYQKLRDIIMSGELGELRRTNWIITNWYRPQRYYDSGGWRATWEGEGGGVLLNQAPHQLDLWQWTCGMPKRVRAFMGFGRHRDIEVENDVTAYVEYENGATGVFITCTTDAPGTNRFEITGENGKIVIEDEKLTFFRNRISEARYNANSAESFGMPECWKCEVPILGENPQHVGILNNWVSSILKGNGLLAPGEDGIKGLEISNAMHLSAWTDNWVELPMDEDLYLEMLEDKIKNSKFRKKASEDKIADISGSFNKIFNYWMKG